MRDTLIHRPLDSYVRCCRPPLNARAIASLQGNVAQIQGEVGSLIKDMEASIAEANKFIDQMQKAEGK